MKYSIIKRNSVITKRSRILILIGSRICEDKLTRMVSFGLAKCKERILRQFENLENYKDLDERSLERDRVAKRRPSIQILLITGLRN